MSEQIHWCCLQLVAQEVEGWANERRLLMEMRFGSIGGDESVPQYGVLMVEQLCEYTEMFDLCILNGCIIQCVNETTLDIFKKSIDSLIQVFNVQGGKILSF